MTNTFSILVNMRVITQGKTTFNYKYNYQVTSNVLDSLFEWVDGR